MAISRITSASPAWGNVAATKPKVSAPVTTAAPAWSGVAATQPAPTPPSAYVGPTTSTQKQGTAAAPRSYPSSYQVTPGYDLSIPGASEYLYGESGSLRQPGYAEGYAQSPAYASAQGSTMTNRLINTYGGAMAQPTQFENYAYSTPAPTGGLYGVIAANQGQVTGRNDVLEHGRTGRTDSGYGDSAFAGSSYMVTDPTRIGGYMSDTGAYGGAAREGFGDDVAIATGGLVAGNTVGGYAADPNARYGESSDRTTAARELTASRGELGDGSASGSYWESLQRDPTALPDANLDAYYDRQREKMQIGLDKALASRGLLGSSYGVDTTREGLLDLAAQQVKDESDYSIAAALARNDIMGGAAGRADEAGVSRYVARNDAARGVDTAALGLSRLGLDARTAQDENSLARYIAQNDVAQGIDKFGLDLYLGRGDLMNRSDLTDTARFGEYNRAADALDDTDIAAFNARTAALDAGGNLDVARFRANTDATAEADRTGLNRYIAQSNVMRDAANTQLDRYRALTDSATAADAASRSLYEAGGRIASAADDSANTRVQSLIELAGNADLSRVGRAQQASNDQYNYTSLLDSILNSGYGDLIQSDEDLISLMTQLGYGAGGVGYQTSLGNIGTTAANGARIQQAGAQADAAANDLVSRFYS